MRSPRPDPEAARAVGSGHALRAAVLAAVLADRDARDDAGGANGGWRGVAHEFARRLRGRPELVDLGPEAAADLIEPVLEDLLAAGELDADDEHDPVWERALGCSDSAGREVDPEGAFLRLWPTLRPGLDLAEAAAAGLLRAAVAAPAVFGEGLSHPRRLPFRVFLAFAVELSNRWGGAFPLAVEPCAVALSTDRWVLGAWRRDAVTRGLLREVEPPRAHRAAARYEVTPELRRLAAGLPSAAVGVLTHPMVASEPDDPSVCSHHPNASKRPDALNRPYARRRVGAAPPDLAPGEAPAKTEGSREEARPCLPGEETPASLPETKRGGRAG